MLNGSVVRIRRRRDVSTSDEEEEEEEEKEEEKPEEEQKGGSRLIGPNSKWPKLKNEFLTKFRKVKIVCSCCSSLIRFA